jgi:hypothetical protein
MEFSVYILIKERLERGGPCCLLKLRRMGTQRVQMKRGPCLVGSLACHAGTRDFWSALAAVVRPVQIFFSHNTLFKFLCPNRPASWEGIRAGSPVF